jgi:hypothetical protein
VTPAQWQELLDDPDTVQRYGEFVHRRGPTQCWYWTGALSDSAHGKFRAGSRRTGNSVVVTSHVFGWALAHGPESVGEQQVTRHSCDEASCSNPAHWIRGKRVQNVADYLARRHLTGHPLADTRGPRGRAVAIRDAILAARAAGADIEAAIAEAIAAGERGGGRQEALF